VNAVTGLAGARALRVLTLHSTPLADAPAYRGLLLALCPALLALDGAARSDADTLPAAHRLAAPLAAFAAPRRAGLPPLPRLGESATLEDHALAHLRLRLAAHRAYATAGAPLTLQRAARGRAARNAFRAAWRRRVPPVLRLQRWLLRAWVTRKVLPAARAAAAEGHFAAARALADLPPGSGAAKCHYRPWSHCHSRLSLRRAPRAARSPAARRAQPHAGRARALRARGGRAGAAGWRTARARARARARRGRRQASTASRTTASSSPRSSTRAAPALGAIPSPKRVEPSIPWSHCHPTPAARAARRHRRAAAPPPEAGRAQLPGPIRQWLRVRAAARLGLAGGLRA
jgi:hypothetical protein